MGKKIHTTRKPRTRRKGGRVPNGLGSATDAALAARKQAQSQRAHAVWQAQLAADRQYGWAA